MKNNIKVCSFKVLIGVIVYDIENDLLQWQVVVDEDQCSREPSAAEAEEVFPGGGN